MNEDQEYAYTVVRSDERSTPQVERMNYESAVIVQEDLGDDYEIVESETVDYE